MSGGIVIITDEQDRHGFFVSQLIDSGLPIHGIITGAKRRLLKSSSPPPDHSPADRQALKTVKRQRLEAEAHYFGGASARLHRRTDNVWWDHVQEADGDINNARFVTMLADARPACIAVMGATMLRSPLLDLPCPLVNMHTGLSPYYRGGRSNMWPILEDEYGYFGVTVHRIAPGIDDGDILASERVLVEPDDNYPRLNARSILAGTRCMIDVLHRLLAEPHLSGIGQWEAGKLFHDRDYTPAVAAEYLARLPAYLDEHRRRQRTGELDEVRLVSP